MLRKDMQPNDMQRDDMTALLKDPVTYLFQAPAPRNDVGSVMITIEAVGRRWWILHRSDGKSGGVFDHKAAALHQAKIDTIALPSAIIAIIESDGSEDRQRYERGSLAGPPGTPRLKLVDS